MPYKIQSPLQLLANKKGVVAPLFAVLAPVMLGTAGLAIDSGHIFLRRTQIQKTLDAAALKAITLRNTILIPTNTNLRSADINEKIEEAKRKSENFAKGNLKLSGIDYVHVDGRNPIQITYIEGGPNQPTEALATVTPGAIKVSTFLVHILDENSDGIDINLDKQRAKAIRPPALLALVLDTSFSMEEHMDTLKEAAKDFVASFDPQMDQVAVISYGTRARVVRSMQRYAVGTGTDTSLGTVEDINAMIDTMTAEGDTNIQEGIIKARKEIERVAYAFPDARRFMVVLSDGAPTAMTARFQKTRSHDPKNELGGYPIAPWNGKYVYKTDLTAIDAAEAAELPNPLNPLIRVADTNELRTDTGNECIWYPHREDGDDTGHQVPCYNFGGAVLATPTATSYFQDNRLYQATEDWSVKVTQYGWTQYNSPTYFTLRKKDQVFEIDSFDDDSYRVARCSVDMPSNIFKISGSAEPGYSPLYQCLESLEYKDSRSNPHNVHNTAINGRNLQSYFIWPERYPVWHAALFESDYAKELITTASRQHLGNIEFYVIGFGDPTTTFSFTACYDSRGFEHVKRQEADDEPVDLERMKDWRTTCPGGVSSFQEASQ